MDFGILDIPKFYVQYFQLIDDQSSSKLLTISFCTTLI